MTVALILTGPPETVSAEMVIREGAHDHLAKPYDPAVVKAIVGRAIERVALARTLRVLTEELDEANAKLRANAVQLQRRIDDATAELRQKVADLDEAKRGLEEAHHQREEFISMIAHELGNPLTAVSGYVQLIAWAGMPAEAQERARATVLAETRRMSRLLEDLSDASRMAAGHFRIRPVQCDLAGAIGEQVDLVRPSAGDQSIEFDYAGGPLLAVCDRDRVAQVLANLLSNAIKYAPGGQVTVRLVADGQQAHVTV